MGKWQRVLAPRARRAEMTRVIRRKRSTKLGLTFDSTGTCHNKEAE